ncbi:MAG: glycosyltransferase family 4 protein [Bacteroidales bacterium]|jgi:glycosyltransferase involved in cell wall biosynthesis|nr:glycosyltransferase family 4 protein [Bacteroidales bacterium]
MRLGFEAKRAFFNTSGLGNYARNMLIALQQFYPEHEYLLFTPKYSESLFSSQNYTVITPENGWKYFHSLWRLMGMSATIDKQVVDIFHGLSNELPRGIGKSNAKSVVTIHDLIFMRYPEWYKKHDRIIYQNKTEYACKYADKIVAISEQTKSDLIHYLNIKEDRIEVIHQPALMRFMQNGISEEKTIETVLKYRLPEQYLLMVGNIEKRKNIANVIQAKLHGGIDVPLYIVGRETLYAKELKNRVASQKGEDIYFLHHVSTEELFTLYRNAAILIYPSYFEGFGLPVIESLMCGTPVIASHGSCLVETAGDGALYIDPDNVEQLIETVRQLLQNRTMRKELVEKGQKHIRQFEPLRIAFKMNELYKSLI